MSSIRALLLISLIAGSLLGGEAAPSLPQSFEKDVKPLLNTYCYKCHGPDKQKGDVNFASYPSGDAAMRATKLWRTSLEKLVDREMPPEDKPQPSDAERAVLTGWIQRLKDSLPPDPGRVTTRRLNRAEYNNTIRDLIGLDTHPAEDFPSDDVGEGFDNIGDVLSMPPLLMEKYLASAEELLDKAIVVEQVNLKYDVMKLPAINDVKPAADAKERMFTAAGQVECTLVAPVDGKYSFKIRAGGDQAGKEGVRMGIKLDDKLLKEQSVMSSRTSPSSIPLTLDLKRGEHHLALLFLNPYQDEPPKAPAPPPPPPAPAGGGKKGGNAAKAPPPPPAPAPAPPTGPLKTRALAISGLEVLGPPSPPIPESHKRIMIAKPSADLKSHDAAQQIIEKFATRAYRQPVAKEQLDRLLKLFDTAEQQGEVFEESIKLVLEAILISPKFLFRIELDRKGDGPNGAYQINDWELASRLSYFIWSSMPDDELFDLARAGKLQDPATIEKQARRMLRDPRSRALVDNFATQWLTLRKLEIIEPDPKLFPEFDKALRKAMHDEVTTYFEMIMREDRSVLEFIDSDYAYVNDRLAKHYGMAEVKGPNLRKVTLTDHNRGGVLGMAAILTITSNPTRTSPVKRGKWVLENLLASPPPPPPPMVEALDKQDAAVTASQTLRQRMERHRTDPVCASCHQRMDPIGFGFENFDAIGRWRTSENSQAIDTAGTLPNGQKFAGPQELKGVFTGHKEAFVRCLTMKMLTFALGRGVQEYDDRPVSKISKALEGSGYKFSTLVVEIAKSYPFTWRRPK